MTQMFGDLSDASTILSLQGSSGNVGVAYVHAIRGNDNLLDGLAILDTSGFDYVHQGGQSDRRRSLKTAREHRRYAIASGHVHLDPTATTTLCAPSQTGPIPCGYGPGNSNYRHLALESLSDKRLSVSRPCSCRSLARRQTRLATCSINTSTERIALRHEHERLDPRRHR